MRNLQFNSSWNFMLGLLTMVSLSYICKEIYHSEEARLFIERTADYYVNYISDLKIFRSDFWFASSEGVRNLIIILATLIGVYPALNRLQVANRTSKAAEKQAKIAAVAQIIEQITTATKNLSSDNYGLRWSTLIALKKIYELHPEEAESVQNLLEGFIRGKLLWMDTKNLTDNDTQLALDIALDIGAKNPKLELDLSDCDLSSIAIKRDKINNINFTRSKIASQNFHRKKLSNCKFDEVILNGADFSISDISRCTFKKSNLEKANFTNTRIWFSDFEECLMKESIFIKVGLGIVRFTNANLEYSNFSGSYFKNVYFKSCDLKNTNFTSTSMDAPAGLDFKDSFLENSDFNRADLRPATGIDKQYLSTIKNYNYANHQGKNDIEVAFLELKKACIKMYNSINLIIQKFR